MNVRLRLMTYKDIPDSMRLKEIAGWNQTIADWQRFLSASPQGCFVAEHDGRAIGTVTTIIYEDRFAWIAQLSGRSRISRPRNRQESSRTAQFRYLDTQNLACMKLDATPLGKPLYEKLGFETEYEIERWMLKRPIGEKEAQSKAVEIEDALRLDREIFGVGQERFIALFGRRGPGIHSGVSTKRRNRRIHVRASRRACRSTGTVDGR